MRDLRYNTGFGSHFESEAVQGTLPVGQNSPQRPAMGLYAEQLNGSAFTRPRALNLRSWMYRLRPSAVHSPYEPMDLPKWQTPPLTITHRRTPQQLRWSAFPWPTDSKVGFVESMTTWVGNGDVNLNRGAAVHYYAATAGMEHEALCNADGELILIPQEGALALTTELGPLEISPGEIAVIPRGIKFAVQLPDSKARGYCCENFGLPLVLPELGPIGANGLANPRDFCYPVAQFSDAKGSFRTVTKYRGQFWQSHTDFDPFNVVAWHGNYAPYKYDLKRFNTINTVSFDHPDPSIFTVLTSPSEVAGVANLDFVIFPSRWMVAEKTLRLPYYHRNVMSEFMGLIYGVYDAKPDGFVPGGCSLHNCMSGHGPDTASLSKAESVDLVPERYQNTLAFMIETFLAWDITDTAFAAPTLQKNYFEVWK